MKPPAISICMPVYNGAGYVAEAIESVVRQDFPDWELVICDDASTDETPRICRQYRDERIRYLRFSENAGHAGNFNRSFRAATGEFLTLLSADDFFLPGMLADRVTRFQRQPDIDVVVGAVVTVDTNGRTVAVSQVWPEDRLFRPGELVKPLLGGAIVNTLSLVVRRTALERVGLFRTELTWGVDWEWLIRLSEKLAIAYASQPVAAYRVHDGSATAQVLKAGANAAVEAKILREALGRLTDDRTPRATRRLAFHALALRQMYFAAEATLAKRRRVALTNLWHAARADCWTVAHPTFWAICIAAVGPVSFYRNYCASRDAIRRLVRRVCA